MLSFCPICSRSNAQLSQHLRVFHRVRNLKERKLLLALESGRVKFREGKCSVPGCDKTTTRLDRHIKTHTELTKADQRQAIRVFKRRVILQELAALRASNPDVPMASKLDLVEVDDPMPVLEEQEEEFQNTRCQRRAKEVADLNEQVDTLSGALRDLSHRFRILKRKSVPTPSAQVKRVTKTLLSALETTEPEEAGTGEDPGEASSSLQETPSSLQETPTSLQENPTSLQETPGCGPSAPCPSLQPPRQGLPPPRLRQKKWSFLSTRTTCQC